MSIERNLRDLLSAPVGLAPDPTPDVAIDLIERWLAWRAENEQAHVRQSTAPFFASDATGCARQTAYNYLSRTLPDAPGPSNPPSVADEWRFALGNAGHDIIQAAVADEHQEVRAVLQRDDLDLVSSRADLFEDGTLVEVKTAGGYKFKMMATDFKGAPEGPSWSYVVQLALTAKALHEAGHTITRGVVVVLAMENLSKSWKGVDSEYDRFCAQWTFGWDELEPIADKAIARLQRVAALLVAGDMPPRNIDDPALPRAAVVVDPATGRWEAKRADGDMGGGTTWMCGYCRWQDQCITDAAAEALGATVESP